MKELILEQLKEYQDQYEVLKAECIALMKSKQDNTEEFLEKAKKAGGLKMMIEVTILELGKYV